MPLLQYPLTEAQTSTSITLCSFTRSFFGDMGFYTFFRPYLILKLKLGFEIPENIYVGSHVECYI